MGGRESSKRKASPTKPRKKAKQGWNSFIVKDNTDIAEDLPWDNPVPAEPTPPPLESKKKVIKKKGYEIEVEKKVKEDKVVHVSHTPAKKSTGRSFFNQPKVSPPHLGSKQIPKGEPYCLYGYKFVVTGVLDSIERDDAVELIRAHGGYVTKGVIKSLTHAVVGTEAGPSKLAQIKSRPSIQVLDEDGLFQLVREAKGKQLTEAEMSKLQPCEGRDIYGPPTVVEAVVELPDAPKGSDKMMWVDKYKPYHSEEIMGNRGQIQEMKSWLTDYQAGNAKKRALLCSGPPGIGKTTSAHIIAREFGYEPIEFNASDVRSSTVLKQQVKGIVDGRVMGEFFQMEGSTQPESLSTKKLLLIMDEVDGMSAGDRGGAQELAKIVEVASVPIICICNDRNNPKLNALVKVSKEIAFRHPMLQDILPRMKLIMKREEKAISEDVLKQLVENAGGDIRQVLYSMQLWTEDSSVAQLKEMQWKNVERTPHEVIPKLFTVPGDCNLRNRMDYYFVDNMMVPLMVQESYLKAPGTILDPRSFLPPAAASILMNKAAGASDAISHADILNQELMKNQTWSLAPTISILSTVYPSWMMGGSAHVRGEFPRDLGKQSSIKKRTRILHELHHHVAPHCSMGVEELALEGVSVLESHISSHLLEGKEGVEKAYTFMTSYGLDREDYQTLTTLAMHPTSGVKGSTKSALTRVFTREQYDIKKLNK